VQIINEFDRWLAAEVVNRQIPWAQLPAINDAFRDYFADTRSSASACTEPKKGALTSCDEKIDQRLPNAVRCIKHNTVRDPNEEPCWQCCREWKERR